MIDYHCHLLPGLDDGPATIEESLAMARALAGFGFRKVCCTPHCIKGHYEFSPVEVREAVSRLQLRLAVEDIFLTLHPGMEYYLDECFESYAANLLPLGDSRLVLCEAPPQAHPGLVAEMAGLIVVQGFIPLIAHPERSEPVMQILEAGFEERGAGHEEDPESLPPSPDPAFRWFSPGSWFAKPRAPHPEPRAPSRDLAFLPDDCLFQANLGSFTGFYGARPQRRAYELLQRGTYACFASDLHDASAASDGLLELARDKVAFNPALQKLGAFRAAPGQGGDDQLAFW